MPLNNAHLDGFFIYTEYKLYTFDKIIIKRFLFQRKVYYICISFKTKNEMKTITSIAKDEIMKRQGFEDGDFTLKFSHFELLEGKKSSVLACFDVYSLSGELEQHISLTVFDYGFVTKSGYKSNKVVPVEVSDPSNLTIEEIKKLAVYKANYKVSTFDPFWHEHEAQRRNVSAWNFIMRHYVNDPYCTGTNYDHN